MPDDADGRRLARAANARAHEEAQRRQAAEESRRAQVLLDQFVARARAAGLPSEELLARSWSGRGRYRTGVRGWYLRRDQSVGVGEDAGFYVLNVAPVRWGRWRTVPVSPSPPPLEVGRGARDGEAVALDVLLDRRLRWDPP